MADSKRTRYAKKDDEKSSAVYDVEELAHEMRQVKRYVQAIVVGEDEGEDEAGAEGAGEGGEPEDEVRPVWRFVDGVNYWLNVETGERSQDPPPRSRGGGLRLGIGAIEFSNRDVASAYDDAARLAQFERRNETATIQLRRACNFLKDGPIRVSLAFWIHALRKSDGSTPRMNVLDLCCGRGQDFDKYRRACRDSGGALRQLVGVDIAGEEAIKSAQERWKQVQTHVATGHDPLCGGIIRADISQRHSGQTLVEATATWPSVHRPHLESFHLGSCMFALHYFWSSQQSFTNLVMGSAWMIREGGFFTTVHADGEAMAALYHANKTKVMQVGLATITFHDATITMLEDQSSEYASKPFGWAYDFNLPGAVTNVTEYLVHSPTRDRIMDAHHFVKLFDEPADSVLMRMRHVEYWEDAFIKCKVDCDGSGNVTEETLDHLAMYRVCIYTKNVARVDVEIARRFIRTKLGYSS